MGLAIWDQAMESPGTVASFSSFILGVYGKSLRYRDSPDLRRLLFLFWLELVETPDNFETSGEVLMHGLHLKIEGYAEETVAMRGHVAGLHAT